VTLADARTVFDDAQGGALAASDSTHWWFASKAAIVRSLIRRFAPDEGGLMVDIGAGAGGVTDRLTGFGPDVVAIEGSPSLAGVASARGLPAVCGLTDRVPVRTGAASAATLLDVIEHLPDPVTALREAHRILKPGGVVVVTVPAHSWLWSDADVVLGHVKRYTRRVLSEELERAGLSVRWCSHVFSWLVPPVFAARRASTQSPEEKLGLGADTRAIRIAARMLTVGELALLDRVRLPLGTSVAAVALAPG
jgi:SAM-dependent methyltransferase